MSRRTLKARPPSPELQEVHRTAFDRTAGFLCPFLPCSGGVQLIHRQSSPGCCAVQSDSEISERVLSGKLYELLPGGVRAGKTCEWNRA